MPIRSDPTLAELERAAPSIRALVRRLVRDDATADDVMQETGLRALEHPPRSAGNVRGWLAVVARNLALRSRRSESRRRRRQMAVARPEATPSTVASLERLEAHRRVIECVHALDEPCRALVVERYFEGASAETLAERHGMSRATVDRRLAVARAELREMLAPRRTDGVRRWAPALVAIGGDAADATAVSTATTAALVSGGLIVSVKTVLLVAAVSAVSFAAGWSLKPAPELAPQPVSTADSVTDADLQVPTLEAGSAVVPTTTSEDTTTTPDELPTDAEVWLVKINAAKNAILLERRYEDLCRLDPIVSRDILLAIYARIEPAARRGVCLRVVTSPSWRVFHPYGAAILYLGVHDPDITVQNTALQILRRVAQREFVEDLQAYEEWHQANGQKEAKVLVAEGVEAFVRRIERLSGPELVSQMERHHGLDLKVAQKFGVDMRALYVEAGAVRLADRLWRDRSQDETVQNAAINWLAELGVDEAYLRKHVVPVIEQPGAFTPIVYSGAIHLLAVHGKPWALPILLEAFETAPLKQLWWTIATAVAGFEDLRWIPTMIGMIQADDTEASIYGIGYYGLGKVTGVTYDENHDGAWWGEWWEKNRHRYPADVRDLEIPRLGFRARDIVYADD